VRRLGRPRRRPVLVVAALGGPRGRARARRRLVGVGGGGTTIEPRTTDADPGWLHRPTGGDDCPRAGRGPRPRRSRRADRRPQPRTVPWRRGAGRSGGR